MPAAVVVEVAVASLGGAMPSAGDQVEMPDGNVYIVRRPSAESAGECVEMEFVVSPGCVPPPAHVQRHQVEAFRNRGMKLLYGGCWSVRVAG